MSNHRNLNEPLMTDALQRAAIDYLIDHSRDHVCDRHDLATFMNEHLERYADDPIPGYSGRLGDYLKSWNITAGVERRSGQHLELRRRIVTPPGSPQRDVYALVVSDYMPRSMFVLYREQERDAYLRLLRVVVETYWRGKLDEPVDLRIVDDVEWRTADDQHARVTERWFPDLATGVVEHPFRRARERYGVTVRLTLALDIA